MAYIVPNTDIVLCRDVPLDSSYDHTVDFADANAQWAYFYSKRYKVVSVNSYQRVMSGRLRIECTMEDAIQCNYLYFRNNNFEDKFFYAFITGWYYVNNITTEISYEIDVFQTFWFDIRLLQVFVEREHIQNDQIGANLVPESLEQGDYIVDGYSVFDPYNIPGVVATNASAIFYCTFQQDKDDQGQVTGYSKFNGNVLHYVYTGLCPIVIGSKGGIQQFIQAISSSDFPFTDGVVAGYMCPFEPLTYDNIEDGIQWSFRIGKHNTSLAGYVPKNKKLFTAPYNTLRVVTDSDSETYNFEYFSDPSFCEFTLIGYFLPEPVLVLVPKNFNAATQRTFCLENRMTIKEFPQIAIDVDVWKVYFAQHGASLVTSMIGQGIETGAKLLAASQGGLAAGAMIPDISTGKLRAVQSAPMAGNMNGGISADPVSTLNAASSFTGIATSLAQLYELSKRPPELKGAQTALSDFSIGAKHFYAQNLCIRPEFAKIIDDYFDMFGYATHEVKQPNITGRPHWNYVKTIGNTVDALGVPDPYLKVMNAAFNKGITIWHNPNEVGTYSLDNRPV